MCHNKEIMDRKWEDVLEEARHCYRTLHDRRREFQMKMRNPPSIYLKPYSVGNLCPVFHGVCSFPIDEEVPTDDCFLMQLGRPLYYVEINASHYNEWKERRKIQMESIGRHRKEEKEYWQKLVEERDLKNEIRHRDEYDVTIEDFTMDFN